jgi:hypothetical protein
MEHFFSALAFAGLIAAQFLAVVFVARENPVIRYAHHIRRSAG